MMEIVTTRGEMQARAAAWRNTARRVAFVPTMGYLHAGHISLLEAGRRAGDVLVLSIFVNPAQFGPKEDLSRYPRDLEGDLEKARRAGVDVVFVPKANELYPDGYQTYVEVRQLEKGLCGDRRPGHFVGVATVVLKLFNLVKPCVALFGEKDYQQLQLIRRMVLDLDLEIEVRGLPIVREPDGLALSSRNAYLSPEERARALVLSRTLFAVAQLFAAGERDGEALLGHAESLFARARASSDFPRLEYLELRDAETLKTLSGPISRPAVLALAAFVGTTRLIDNVPLRP
jgi:pantoate--beta-alanine ligase